MTLKIVNLCVILIYKRIKKQKVSFWQSSSFGSS